jgi:hypothetical protein
MVELRLSGVVIEEPSGYSSLCLELDVASQGESVRAAQTNLVEAVQLYAETALEHNLPLLRPVSPEELPWRRRRKVVRRFPIRLLMAVTADAAAAGT